MDLLVDEISINQIESTLSQILTDKDLTLRLSLEGHLRVVRNSSAECHRALCEQTMRALVGYTINSPAQFCRVVRWTLNGQR